MKTIAHRVKRKNEPKELKYTSSIIICVILNRIAKGWNFIWIVDNVSYSASV